MSGKVESPKKKTVPVADKLSSLLQAAEDYAQANLKNPEGEDYEADPQCISNAFKGITPEQAEGIDLMWKRYCEEGCESKLSVTTAKGLLSAIKPQAKPPAKRKRSKAAAASKLSKAEAKSPPTVENRKRPKTVAGSDSEPEFDESTRKELRKAAKAAREDWNATQPQDLVSSSSDDESDGGVGAAWAEKVLAVFQASFKEKKEADGRVTKRLSLQELEKKGLGAGNLLKKMWALVQAFEKKGEQPYEGRELNEKKDTPEGIAKILRRVFLLIVKKKE
jgi:hypothetical protein